MHRRTDLITDAEADVTLSASGDISTAAAASRFLTFQPEDYATQYKLHLIESSFITSEV